jgi:hypothetical protein
MFVIVRVNIITIFTWNLPVVTYFAVLLELRCNEGAMKREVSWSLAFFETSS